MRNANAAIDGSRNGSTGSAIMAQFLAAANTVPNDLSRPKVIILSSSPCKYARRVLTRRPLRHLPRNGSGSTGRSQRIPHQAATFIFSPEVRSCPRNKRRSLREKRNTGFLT